MKPTVSVRRYDLLPTRPGPEVGACRDPAGPAPFAGTGHPAPFAVTAGPPPLAAAVAGRRDTVVRSIRVVGSSVWNSRSRTPTSAPVSAFKSVDLPAFVQPTS